MEMCPGIEQRGRKHQGAAGEGSRIQLDVSSQNKPHVFQAEGLAAEEGALFTTPGAGARLQRWHGWAQGGEYQPCTLQRWEEQRPINPSPQGQQSYCLAHTHSQLLCQFGSSPAATQNAATPSLLSGAVSASQQPGQSQAPAPDHPTRASHSCRAQLRLAGLLCRQWSKGGVPPGRD